MLQPPPKPTAEERAALYAYEQRKARNAAALTIFHALLLKDKLAPREQTPTEHLIDEAYKLANDFIAKGKV